MANPEPRTRFLLPDAEAMMIHFRVDPSIVPPRTLLMAMNVELEHGTRVARHGLDVTNGRDEPAICAAIALSHLAEDPGTSERPNYYVWLSAQEEAAEAYYKSAALRWIPKPNIFLTEPYAPFSPRAAYQ